MFGFSPNRYQIIMTLDAYLSFGGLPQVGLFSGVLFPRSRVKDALDPRL